MILETHEAMNATLRTVFTIFAGVWVGIVVVLFLATGFLLKKAERMSAKQHPGGHH